MAAEARRRPRRQRSQWRRLRQAVQALTLLGFLALFIAAARHVDPPAIVHLPFHLDPLAMLAQTLASRTFQVSSAAALATVGLTLIFGRAWCGWLCPLGTVLDAVTPRRRPAARASLEGWRAAKYLMLVAVLLAALFGSLALLILDPVTIVFRALAAGVWPALDWLVTALERLAYNVEALRPSIIWIDSVLRPAVFPVEPASAAAGLGVVLLLAVIIGLNWLAPRFWCRALCPLGGLLALLSKVALVRRHVNPACSGCTACVRLCPTDTIRADRDFASDPAECTVCMDCVDGCPLKDTSFRFAPPQPAWRAYDPTRRQALATIGASVIGFGLLTSDLLRPEPSSTLLRPPGATNDELLRTCILRGVRARLSDRCALAGRDRGRGGGHLVADPCRAPGILRLLVQRLRTGLPGGGDPATRTGGEAAAGDWHRRDRPGSLLALGRSNGLHCLRGDVPAAREGHPVGGGRGYRCRWGASEDPAAARRAQPLHRLRHLRVQVPCLGRGRHPRVPVVGRRRNARPWRAWAGSKPGRRERPRLGGVNGQGKNSAHLNA